MKLAKNKGIKNSKSRLSLGQRVVVGLSGGVDSAVSAALLKDAGFDVVGVFMRFWKDEGGGENRCCSPESEKRARTVAEKLNIPFYVLNFEKEFKKKVVDVFLSEYKKGSTPNPCVVCNSEIKFGLLIDKALKMGADYVATGHYARLRLSKKTENQNRKIEIFKLLKGKDKEKDQSYFLWRLNQGQLSHILFPVGNYTKIEVRKMAKKYGLPVAGTPDSQEICFAPNGVNSFLKKYLRLRAGKIIDTNGRVLGKHEGLQFYTIGQRKGIKLPQGPYYVAHKDYKNNNLIISKSEKDLLDKTLTARDVNWIFEKPAKLPIEVKTKIRYRSSLFLAKIFLESAEDKKYKVVFNGLQRAITPGQSVVFYIGNELVAGGIIDVIR